MLINKKRLVKERMNYKKYGGAMLLGVNKVVVSACATGSHSIGDAFRTIQYGDADVMIAGGCEAGFRTPPLPLRPQCWPGQQLPPQQQDFLFLIS